MVVHRVRKGETLWSISKKYSVTIEAIAKLNRINPNNYIRREQLLKIPDKREKNSSPARPPHVPPSPPPVKATESDMFDRIEDTVFTGKKIAEQWLEELLQRLRMTESEEDVQQEEKIPLTKEVKPSTYNQQPARKPNSRGKKTIADVKADFKARLGKEPAVVTFKGVKLSRNERKQITAAVALCEMNNNGFGSINDDQEFVGRKYGARGIGGLTYSRIVHIGLSYGVIQFTQDSGSLGDALKQMSARNPSKFIEIFGEGDGAIAGSLLTLTSAGHPDVQNDTSIPLSGQAYWNKIKKKPEGQELSRLANGSKGSNLPVSREIRGKRVQPLSPRAGEKPIDIWTGVWKERFLAAGEVTDFQEAQLDLAVDSYFDKILPQAKKNGVRSALALAFIAACAIRGGVGSDLSMLFYKVAAALKIALPFVSSDEERKCLDEIASARGSVAGVAIHHDESRRARKLIDDELGFLSEDLYDLSTY